MSLTIADIALAERPLLVCDVDEVVLQFVAPFAAFLESRNLRLVPRSFHLNGNIERVADGAPVEPAAISSLIDGFFDEQHRWQQPVEGARAALSALSADADIVFLTAMPPAHYARRRAVLDAFGFPQPLLATKEAKGPLIALMHGERAVPVAFIDDMAHNLHSVAASLASCRLVHLTPATLLHGMAPAAPSHALTALNWQEAEEHIRAHLLAETA